MAADNVTLSSGSGGAIIRTLSDGTDEWPVGVCTYATTISPGANVLQVVTQSYGLPATIVGGGNAVTVYQAHNVDNQTLGGSAYAVNTGGVAQLLNPAGAIDRQRETGFDGVPSAGIATGAQQYAVPFATTIASSIATGSHAATPASMTGIQAGSSLAVANSGGGNAEIVFVTAVTGTTFTATYTLSKTGPGITVNGFYYNQARDASIGDAQALTGLSASATYLYNNVTGLAELDRSANGEKDGATGQGTSIAAEYEFNGGGPLTNAGSPTGLAFDRGRNLQGKGKGTATQSAGGAAGATSITVSSATATATILPGQQIRIDRNTVNEECAYVTPGYTPGTAAISLQSALAYTHSGAAVEWDIFASTGPGLNGFTATGIGVEEEALFNPADGQYYIERSATSDGMAGANIVAECPAVWNGSTFDRLKGSAATGALVTNADQVAALCNGQSAVTPQYFNFSTSSSGTSTVVAATSGKKIYLLRWSASANGNTTFNFQSHTTTTLATGTKYLTQYASAGGSYCPPGIMATATGEGLDINNGSAIAISGEGTYVQF